MDNVAVVVALIGGPITAVVAGVIARRRSPADRLQIIEQATVMAVERLRADLERAHAERDECAAKIKDALSRISHLEAQVRRLSSSLIEAGIDPDDIND